MPYRNVMSCRRKRFLIFLLIVGLAMTLVLGCGTEAEKKKVGENIPTQGDHGFPVTITDQKGRQIIVDECPERLVSLSPSNTEIIYALGLEDLLVGVTDFCEYPEGAKSKPKVGGFQDPNVEVIVSMKPDIVFTTDLHEQVVAQLEELGIVCVVLNPGNMEEMLESIEMMGTATGALDRALDVTSDLRIRIKAVADEGMKIPDDERPRVYYEIFPSPLITAGPGTFVDDIIKLSGGINIASDAKKAYPEYSLEMIVAKDPQIIIYSHHGSSQETTEDILSRTGWESIEAIREERVFFLGEDTVQLATPRLVDGLESFSNLLKENFGGRD